jgi:hypothetical protein
MVAGRRARAVARLGAGALCALALCALALLAGCDDDTPRSEQHFCPDCPNGQSFNCPSPARLCPAGDCVDVTTDPANCGGCGVSCAAGAQCVAGSCRGAPTATCDAGCRDGETCVAGTCQPNGCPPPLAVCSLGDAQVCTDPRTDRRNCGTCGLACAAGERCIDAVCERAVGCSAPGLIQCDTGCADPSTDPRHCGGCGVACPGACVDGFCR